MAVPSVGDAVSWIFGALVWLVENLLVLLVLGITTIIVAVFFRLRKSILFNAWVNQTTDPVLELGRKLADLLLFDVRDIHNVHNRAPEAGFWNQYRDVPTFRYEIDHDVALLASSELGEQSKLASAVVSVLFHLVPVVFQPAAVRGSIQKSGDDIRFLVTLEGYRPPGNSRKRVSTVWSATPTSPSDKNCEKAVEDLAYALYLELAGAKFFRSATAFAAYTEGLRAHLAYLDFGISDDLGRAEREYRRAIDEDPEAAPPRYNLAALYYAQYTEKSNSLAMEQLLRVVSVNDRQLQAEARSALADCYLQQFHRYGQGRTQRESEVLLDRAIRLSRMALGDAKHLDAVNKALAFGYHQKSQFLYKTRRRAGGSLGPWLRERLEIARNRQRAIRHYRRAIKGNQRHYVAYNNLGNLYLNWAGQLSSDSLLGDLERRRRLRISLRKFEHAVRLRPSYHHSHDNIGNAYKALGDVDEALRGYLTALEYNNDYAEAKNDVAILCMVEGRTAKLPGSDTALDAAGWHFAALETPDVGGDQRHKLCEQMAQHSPAGSSLCPFRTQAVERGTACAL
jgi:tetratricopeptide (TPR) repeat protein